MKTTVTKVTKKNAVTIDNGIFFWWKVMKTENWIQNSRKPRSYILKVSNIRKCDKNQVYRYGLYQN